MTPREKAEELVGKMDSVVGGGNYDAKEYALIAVDEIINTGALGSILTNWWQEVRNEIKNL